MSSLKDAPSLSPTSRKGFSFAAIDYDDDYTGPVETVEEIHPPSKSTSRSKKNKARDSKKPKKNKGAAPVSEVDEPVSSSSVKKTSGSKPVAMSDNQGEDYADDFEDPVDSDDYIPSVGTSPPAAALRPVTKSKALMADVEAEEKRLYATVQEQLRLEKEEVMQRIAKWEADQAQKAEEMRRREEELKRQLAAQQQREQEVKQRLSDLVEQQVSQHVAAASAAGKAAAAPTNTATHHAAAKAVENDETEDADEQGTGVSRAELQRRRRREHERAVSLRRAEEEEAAHALFQRLAQDVREVFHELNLSVVAAEKERLIKDERYRRERELRDRREDMTRAEKLEKELKEREEREAKFWAMIEQRDEKFRTFLEERMNKDEEEREARLRRDLEDRATRLRNERELREEMDKMEKERRAKAEEESRHHDGLVLTAQIEEVSARYRAQLEEVRRQMEADSLRKDELQKAELAMMAKRHEAALEQLQRQHAQQLATMDGHAGNVSRIEALVATMQETMEATKAMNEKLLAERMSVLKQKERQLDERQAVLDAMVAEMKANQETVAAERARVAGLYAKFELALSSFSKNSEEDRRTFREAHAHYDTLRQQAEKDRRLMLGEVAQERKLLEQQFEEFLAKKMEAMAELQNERISIARERAEASMVRERQNRDETDLLKALRSREEEYKMKLESIESDRATACHMKDEHKRLCDAAAAERQALRQEREKFELEKKELLSRFEAIRRQAEDAASSQERLRIQLMGDRSDALDGNGAAVGLLRGGPLVCNAASRFQMDLARQRAVLQNIS
ncbi:conserved hypothetical protein [Leishmania infantum JPCM5]|uniref:Fas-binding factor 1 C-terminal domain-containing protein n=2 Tax=Leishmania infantum TaxID=5671 RepID=A4I5W1_LEIIN|nr:conserved hypothetical protein [Leishmania infantum JPCM5]CAC9515219.1 hypothetical_protein_-_conserved [Leishmania infantum]CAM70183.1 conserved hypothetical protein [Leishmania infantum JPCM5]SUZ44102.1 hypothetical_protein_-_conserved [Leishmania infantum]|eukprot:XP_001467130.1 conserved hypothetical protein [Leishmania infantum JPCM5]